MKLTKGSILALITILELARNSDRSLLPIDIADKYGIPPSFLAKVMRNLVREGLVQTVRGSGRYRFVGNVTRTSLLDVINPFEALAPLASDLNRPHQSRVSVPVMVELQCINKEIDDLTRAVLDAITLETVLKSVHKRIETNCFAAKCSP